MSGSERFDAWRASVAAIFSCEPRAPEEVDGFVARVTAFDLGSVLFAESAASGQRFVRSERLIRSTDIDHLMIQWYRRGGYRGMHAGDDVTVSPGDVSVLDLSRPFKTRIAGDHFHNCNVFIPRNFLLPQLRSGRALHSLRLSVDSALGRIFTRFLAATAEELPHATQAEIPTITQSIVGTVAVLLDSVEYAGDPSSLLDEPTSQAMRDYIEANLQDPHLDADSLCAAFRCSRAYAYRLFREQQGIAAYIMERRLVRVREDLASPACAHQSVSQIAFKWGFSSHSHLCRRFRKRFGMSPGEARERTLGGEGSPTVAPGIRRVAPIAPRYRDWLVRLAERKDG